MIRLTPCPLKGGVDFLTPCPLEGGDVVNIPFAQRIVDFNVNNTLSAPPFRG